MKRIVLGIMCVLLVSILAGCGGKAVERDYSDCFEISNISYMDIKNENMLQVDYSVINHSEEDLSFAVSIVDNSKKYALAAGKSKQDSAIIEIGKPEQYELSYTARFEVLKDAEIIWNKEEEINYDCTEAFMHTATVTYGGESKEIKLKDYQDNYFQLTELFSSFDATKKHNVDIENKEKDLALICKSEDSKERVKTLADGAVLWMGTSGKEEKNDTYHFSDQLKIVISDATPASSVDWTQHMKFLDTANYSTSEVYGMSVTTIKMRIQIDNPSDETIAGTITHLYVNDTMASDEYLAGSSHTYLWPKEEDELYNYSSGPVWKSTGETKVKKFGLGVLLEDDFGNVLYDGIQWLYLK